jgi:hypothetical protein
MALVVRDRHDPIARAIHHCARLSAQGSDEPQCLYVRAITCFENHTKLTVTGVLSSLLAFSSA